MSKEKPLAGRPVGREPTRGLNLGERRLDVVYESSRGTEPVPQRATVSSPYHLLP